MKVMLVGDGLVQTTGFAQVLRQVATELVARGHDVAQIASLDVPPCCDSRPYHAIGVTPYFPAGGNDPIGRSVLDEALRDFEPDVIAINSDPGTCAYFWQQKLQMMTPHLPVVAYLPVEGAPVAPSYASAFAWAQQHGAAYTYTRWSAAALKDAADLDVPWLPHGVDTDVFKPLDTGRRCEVRRQLGWEGMFVVGYVARNNGRKGHDRLLKAMKLLRDGLPDRGVPAREDYRLYLHCAKFDGYALQGWDLGEMAKWFGVADLVHFPSDFAAQKGVKQLDLAQKYGAFDLYVHPSQVEGFGLPLLEAMASGLPVVAPKDGGNMEEVVGDGFAALIEPADWATWFNGALLANLAPEHIALTIHALREQPKVREAASRRARARAEQFSWEPMRRELADAVEQVAAGRRDAEMVACP